MNKKSSEYRAVVQVLLSILSVQAGAAVAKGIFPQLGPINTAALRIFFSAIILIIVNRPRLKALTPAQWKAVIPYGLTLGAMNLVFYMAIARIPLALGVALEFIGPLVLAIMGSRRAIDFLWIVLAAVGLALITPWTHNGIDIIGAALALLAGALWAVYIILGGRVSKIMDSGKAVAIGMIFASLIILPAAMVDGLLVRFQPKLFLPALCLALFSSAIPFTLEMRALRTLPARTFSILMSLEPAVAAVSGLVFYMSNWQAVNGLRSFLLL